MVLQGAYKEWQNFEVYHKLFFNHQTLGPGGYNEDTVSGEEGSGPDEKEQVAVLEENLEAVEEGSQMLRKKRPLAGDEIREEGSAGENPSGSTTRRRSSRPVSGV